jgi:hypothetical protein
VIDRELYLPRGWLADAERCQVAGVPRPGRVRDQAPAGQGVLDRALEAGVPAGWVTADAVYGADRGLRGWLEARQLPYVLAVKRTEPLPLPSGPPVLAARLVQRIPPACWPRRCRPGGPRAAAGTPGATCRWPAPARPPGGSGGCWRVEEALAGRQGAVRPGPRQPGPPLALLVPLGDPGHAGVRVLGGGRSHSARPPPTTVGPHPVDLQPDPAPGRHARRRPITHSAYRLRWSWFRRRHQARARACHYRQQANGP